MKKLLIVALLLSSEAFFASNKKTEIKPAMDSRILLGTLGLGMTAAGAEVAYIAGVSLTGYIPVKCPHDPFLMVPVALVGTYLVAQGIATVYVACRGTTFN